MHLRQRTGAPATFSNYYGMNRERLNNRYVFAIRVPKDFGEKEIVWTVTSHGKTYQAYASLRPQYIRDDEGMQREYFGGGPADGNEPPKIHVSGVAVKRGGTWLLEEARPATYIKEQPVG